MRKGRVGHDPPAIRFDAFARVDECIVLFSPIENYYWDRGLIRVQWGYNGEDRRNLMELHTIGIDLGKTVFHLVGLNLVGEVIVHPKCVRASNCCTSWRT